LTDADRQTIRALADDLPALWRSPQTPASDRQSIVRHLIDQVVVAAPRDTPTVDLAIHWAGGFVSHHHLTRPVARYQQLPEYPQLLARIQTLLQAGHSAAQIAEVLNREGFRPPKRRATFNPGMVRTLASRQARLGPRPRNMEVHVLPPHEWWFADLARHLSLPQPTLYSWLRRGWVQGRQLPLAGGRWILWADEEELDRLRRLHTCPRSWFNQPQAAALTRPKPRPIESQNL